MNLDKLINIGKEIKAKLNEIRISVGANIGDFDPNTSPIEIMTGKEIEELAAANPGKPIIINGKFYLAYIKDHSYYGTEAQNNNIIKARIRKGLNGCFVEGNKVHFYYCHTLQQMNDAGRRKRYRPTAQISNNQIIDLEDAKNVHTRLAWCKNCLTILFDEGKVERWDSQKDKEIMAEDGDAKKLMECIKGIYYKENKDDFAEEKAQDLYNETLAGRQKYREKGLSFPDGKVRPNRTKPLNAILLGKSYTSGLKDSAAPSNYPPNWDKISAAFRKQRNYTCEECYVNCRAYPRLTDAHHRNGDKNDCGYKNLECLCKYHHSKQPLHGRYPVKEEDMKILRQLWAEQGIPNPELF